jgi:hypothetical protein
VSSPPDGSSEDHFFYAGRAQYFTADGAAGSFSQPKPTLSSRDDHTLAELAVESADGHQIVEVGWMVDRPQYQDDNPHLFVFHWVNKTETCYNGCGYVQVSTNPAHQAGTTLTVGSSPAITHQFAIRYFGGNWWIWYETEWIGYFPGSLWQDPTTQQNSFTQLGLAQWFGEVATPQATPCSQMGDGLAGTSQGSAEITYMSFDVQSKTVPANVTYTFQTNPQYYSVGNVTPTSFTFGGPGATTQCPLSYYGSIHSTTYDITSTLSLSLTKNRPQI